MKHVLDPSADPDTLHIGKGALIDPDDRSAVVNFAQAIGHVVAQPGEDISHIIDAIQRHLRSLLEPPKVFAHYPGPVVAIDPPRWTRALCGKAWESAGPAKDCERCPECSAIVEAGWIA